MKKFRITTRATLCSIEKWLNEMNDAGWTLVKYCNWAYTFRKINGKNVRYFLHLMEKNEKMSKKSIRFELSSICKGYFVNNSSLLIFCTDYSCNEKEMVELEQLRKIRNKIYRSYLLKESIFLSVGLVLSFFDIFLYGKLGKFLFILFVVLTLFNLGSHCLLTVTEKHSIQQK